jgi:PfaB family protein
MAWSSWTVAEGGLQKGRFGDVIRRANWHLFPLVGQDTQEILIEADSLRHGLEMGATLSVLSSRTFQILQRSKASDKVAVLLAKSPEELDKEIARALAGVSAAEQKGNLWQTPNGSVFAARPVGAEAKVAFVYPGGFNSYPQIGRDLFFWFPGLYESMAPITGDLGLALNEELLYPWGGGDEDPGGIRPLKPELSEDPVAMLTSGTTLSILYTQIMEGTFGVAPSAAFGYSLGENSMLFSSGVWRKGDEMVRALTESEVFKTELAGPQRTVRRSWGWTDGGDGPVWSNFLLMAPAERVQDALEREKRVYLTHINSPGQVMVGGERMACLRVASELGCRALEASFNVALHCRVVEVQREALRALHDWPVQGHPDAQLFSAATYGPLGIERQAIASSMAQMLVSPLDFVRLVETVYGEGARVFVELGAGSNCSRWIDETLKEEPHVAVSINHRGVDDLQGVLRVAARLISEKVPIRLDAFV